MTAILTTPFAQRNKLPAVTQKTISDRSVAGLGGETHLLVGRANSFRLGHSVLPAALIYISQDKAGALASSDYEGVIGTEILKRFKVIFDYSRRRLILERNDHFRETLEYDMSGMSLRALGDDFRTFKIYQVLGDSPAGKAGLRVGDIIERIDVQPASQLTLEQILQMMKVPGRAYQLTIKRNSETRLATITTRRLI
ncbi:MAG TPA: PDZ domain-containing protein, partial [Pyrinomonadaceae bacterium]|nr:PDZ domain-containing protein [Pyrinomonadaceae bacterium]